jgi:peptidyl-prolyl cis-trans isomerase D
MLIAMRNKVTSIVIKALFGLLTLTFVIWGIGDVFRNRVSTVEIASVGGVDIDGTQITREFDRQMKQLRQVLGPQFDTDQAKQLGLVDRAVATVVARTLYDVYIAKLGLIVTDDEVRRMVAADPMLKNGLGEFDRARFQALLSQLGMSEATYVWTAKHDTLRKWLAAAVTDGARPPDILVDRLYRYRNETRVADLLLVENAKMPEPPAPDEATLVKYHDDNAQYFQSPEYRAVTFVRLVPDDFAAKAQISEADLQAAFEKRAAEFDQPERRTVEQIVLPDEATAKEAAAKLAGGADFAAVAQEFTGAAPVALGTVEQNGFVSDLSALSDAAFATELGKTSEPVQSPLGWHILHVTAIEPASKASFADARDQLERELRQEQSANDMIEVANKLDDALAGGADLAAAADTVGLDALKVDAVDGSGNGPDGKPVAALADSPIGIALAFRTEVAETSSLTEEPNGGYVIVRVDGSTPPATRPLEAVRDQVLASWGAAERGKAAAAKAEAIAQELGAGGDMQAIAAELGVEMRTSSPFKRDGTGADASVTPDLAAKLFGLAVGQAAFGAAQNGQLVGRLAEIVPADPTKDTAGLDQLKADLRTQIEGDVLQQFGDRLHQSVGVQINQPAIDKLF